ncbi:MAG: radical SAM protein [Chloroflexi bacterium]|nr:radical SAM protein [Chloroflexota bacterium]
MATRHLLNLVGDRLRTLPILVLYLTDGCNSRCVTCDIWRSPRRNMRMELIDALVEDAAALHTRWVVLSGGEATQHPDWATAARKFRQIGARVILLTNGLLVSRQIEQVIADTDELVISLDGGTAETYQAIRGLDGFERVLSGIAAAHQAGKPVTTRTTLQQANFREIPQIIQAAKDAGVDRISFLTVDVFNPIAFGPRFSSDPTLAPMVMGNGMAPPEHHPPATALTLDECDELDDVLTRIERDFAADFAQGRIAESPAKLRQMARYFRAILKTQSMPPVRCNAPHTSAVVEVDGQVRPCYFLPTMGQVDATGHTRLVDSLNTEAAVQLRREYRSGQRQECDSCVCPLYKGARALINL